VQFPLVEADVEHVPLRDDTFDLVVSEYGAAPWCDPARWVPEAARVLRAGGRLVFLTNSVLAGLCVPDEAGVAGERLLRSKHDLARVSWPGGGIEHHPGHGEWIRALTSAGLVVDALHELYAPAGAVTPEYYDIATAEWARRWPAEDVWVAHKPSCNGRPLSGIVRDEQTSSTEEVEMADEEMGPIDYLIVEFPGNKMTGEGFPILLDLVDRGLIRILDLLFVVKAEDGTTTVVDISDLDHDGTLDLAVFQGASSGLLDPSDVDDASGVLEPGSSAGILIYENRWAAPLAAALRRGGGQLVARGGIPMDALVASLDAADSGS
jgi:SAM-dependent methyltransferase